MAGSQTVGQDGRSPARRLPFDAAERKKIIVLAVLAVVCAVVVLPQLLKDKGPAAANAATPVAAAQTAVDIDSVVAEMRSSLFAPIGTGGGEAVFTTVDEALDLFVGGVRPQPVPVKSLRTVVFGIPEALRTEEAASAKSLPVPQVAGAMGENDPMKVELSKLNLETVMISSRNRAAIINGEVLHEGELIDGFTIVSIGIDQVSLTKGGRQARLTLKKGSLSGI